MDYVPLAWLSAKLLTELTVWVLLLDLWLGYNRPKRVGECELRKILLPSRVPFPLHNAREHGSTP